MKAIHGSKTKNDRIDSKKIAKLLRAGMIPMAYVYPKAMRSTRDLLRRRLQFGHQRSNLLIHMQQTNDQYKALSTVFQTTACRKRSRLTWN